MLKLLFLFLIFFAGFATAVYVLAPAPYEQSDQEVSVSSEPDFDSDEFVRVFNIGMHKCIGYTKDAICGVSSFVMQKINERQTDT